MDCFILLSLFYYVLYLTKCTYWTIRRQTNSRSVKSRTAQLADLSTRRQHFFNHGETTLYFDAIVEVHVTRLKNNRHRICNLSRDFDRPNAFAVRFNSVHFGRMRGQTHYVSLRFNMASVDIKKIVRISMIIPIITNYSSIGEAPW